MSDKLQKAYEICEKTKTAMESAKANYHKALGQLLDLAGKSTFELDGNFFQIRDRDGSLYICKLKGKPKGRPKGSKNKKKAVIETPADTSADTSAATTADTMDAADTSATAEDFEAALRAEEARLDAEIAEALETSTDDN